MMMMKRTLAGLALLMAILAAADGMNKPQRTQSAQRKAADHDCRPERSEGPARAGPSVASLSQDDRTLRAPPCPPDAPTLAREIEHEDDHVTALELAQWIRDRKPGLRVLDIRPDSEFSAYHIPSAERVPLTTLATMPPADGETLVLYSGGGAHAAEGWVLLRTAGHRHVYFLRGGLLEWMDDVMSPALPTDSTRARVAALSRYFGGVPAANRNASSATAAVAVAKARRRGC
jgi:Rhodanese-related sulfurtransferase